MLMDLNLMYFVIRNNFVLHTEIISHVKSIRKNRYFFKYILNFKLEKTLGNILRENLISES